MTQEPYPSNENSDQAMLSELAEIKSLLEQRDIVRAEAEQLRQRDAEITELCITSGSEEIVATIGKFSKDPVVRSGIWRRLINSVTQTGETITITFFDNSTVDINVDV